MSSLSDSKLRSWTALPVPVVGMVPPTYCTSPLTPDGCVCRCTAPASACASAFVLVPVHYFIIKCVSLCPCVFTWCISPFSTDKNPNKMTKMSKKNVSDSTHKSPICLSMSISLLSMITIKPRPANSQQQCASIRSPPALSLTFKIRRPAATSQPVYLSYVYVFYFLVKKVVSTHP